MSVTDERAALEQALRADSRNASLHYLLGAELAQAREYDAAVSEMRQAIELDPALHTARFQLGLLHLTMAHPDLSLEVWGPLEAQPDVALRSFKQGLEALIRNDFPLCLEHLEAGIHANDRNAPLNRDMAMMAAKVREHLAQEPPQPAGQKVVRTDFSLYEQTRR